jgi:hypothetical protein
MLSTDLEPKYTENKVNIFFKEKIIPNCTKHTLEYTLIKGVLTPCECKYLRELSDGVKLPFRTTINSETFTRVIMERCKSYIPEYAHIDCEMVECYRYWGSPSIDPNWRLVKCDLGGSMRSHLYDTHVKGINERSIFTIIVYLSNNDDGAIVFGKDKILPVEGSVLIFNQSKMHRDDINTDYKYFIRSEIIYRRETKIRNTIDLTAFDIYQKDKETSGEEARDLERRAFEMSPLLEKMVCNY